MGASPWLTRSTCQAMGVSILHDAPVMFLFMGLWVISQTCNDDDKLKTQNKPSSSLARFVWPRPLAAES